MQEPEMQRENPKAEDCLGLLVRVLSVLGLPPNATNSASQRNVCLWRHCLALKQQRQHPHPRQKKTEAEGFVTGAQGRLQLPLDGYNTEMTAKCKSASCSVRRHLA